MEEALNVLLPPNKQMDVTFEFSETPTLYKYLLFLDFTEDGSCILGSSDITGTFWEGTLFYFKDAENLLNVNYSKYYVHMTATDGKFIDDQTIALAEDTGTLNILCLDDSSTLKPMNSFHHAKIISEVQVWNKSSNVLTCAGRTLATWDANSNDPRPLFVSDNQHMDTINSVDTLKSDKNLFLSASSDRRACLWDIRIENSANVLYVNEFSSLTRVVVNPNDYNYVAIGTQAGDVYLVDKRQPGDFIATLHCFDRTVGSLSFNNSNQLAVSGDINEVIVVNSEGSELKEIYRNTKHGGHVKDLKWFNNCLYSCGFGEKELVKHVIKTIP